MIKLYKTQLYIIKTFHKELKINKNLKKLSKIIQAMIKKH